MAPGNRWTLHEYVLRCEQRTGLREALVEGELDRDVVVDALERWGASDVSVVDADYIAVEKDRIEVAGFSSGAKGELLTVAAELNSSDKAAELADRIAVVVDRDYDDLGEDGCLLITDGYSVENYAFSEATLQRFASVALGRGILSPGRSGVVPFRRTPCSGVELYERVLGPLTIMAAVRTTLRELDPPVGVFKRWLDYFKVSRNGEIRAEDERLVKNILATANRSSDFDSVMQVLAGYRESAYEDPFRRIRGKDFVDLLAKLFRSPWGRKVGGAPHSEPRTLARVLILSIDTAVVDQMGLFVALRSRFGEVSP